MSKDSQPKIVKLVQDSKNSIPLTHQPLSANGGTGRPIDPAKLIPPPGPSGVGRPQAPKKDK